MAGKRVHVVMPDELVARIDAALTEGQSRGEFVRRAVERALRPPGGPRAGPNQTRPMYEPEPHPDDLEQPLSRTEVFKQAERLRASRK